MYLIRIDGANKYTLVEFYEGEEAIPPYAILSHTWGKDIDEVSFRAMMDGTSRNIAGYRKIEFCAKQACSDDLQYFWIDTCCIDKSNLVQLTEAINSMYRWYSNAVVCYVYLSDMSLDEFSGNRTHDAQYIPDFQNCRWFTRGWTLQELLASKFMEFFTGDGERLGSKVELESQIAYITGISVEALRDHTLSSFNIDEKFSWMAGRTTRRVEDMVYSLLGIFNVQMPLLYGEGRSRAEARLRYEISQLARYGSPLPSRRVSQEPQTPYEEGTLPEILIHAALNDNVGPFRKLLHSRDRNLNLSNADGETSLHISATVGALKVARYLCAKGAALVMQDHDGKTPLHYAVINNHTQVALELVQAGAIDSTRDNTGKLATDYANDPFARWFLSKSSPSFEPSRFLLDDALIIFASVGHVDAVRWLLENKADVRATEASNLTALMKASIAGFPEIVELICAADSSSIDMQDRSGATSLYHAAIHNHCDVIKILLSHGADAMIRVDVTDFTPLSAALAEGFIEAADTILESHDKLAADALLNTTGVHNCPLLCFFVVQRRADVVAWLIEAGSFLNAKFGEGKTALMEAISPSHDWRVFDMLLIAGASTETRHDTSGSTALQWASFVQELSPNLDIINRLLDAGANVNHVNTAGWSPLTEAASNGCEALLDLLLKRGAYPDVRTQEGCTPLQLACRKSRHFKIVRLLLEHGANPTTQDEQRRSPLHDAVIRGDLKTVQLLIEYKAKLNVRDCDGYTPLMLAEKHGYNTCARLLRTALLLDSPMSETSGTKP